MVMEPPPQRTAYFQEASILVVFRVITSSRLAVHRRDVSSSQGCDSTQSGNQIQDRSFSSQQVAGIPRILIKLWFDSETISVTYLAFGL